jgi:hypothetical protein
MSITKFLSALPPERKQILSAIHEIIINADKKVEAKVGEMMGKEMILYTTGGVFKYGLASVKNYMSLHLMPIYGSPKLHSKYVNLLKDAKFQKGCINFVKAEEMPLDLVQELLKDCAGIDLVALMEQMKKKQGM